MRALYIRSQPDDGEGEARFEFPGHLPTAQDLVVSREFPEPGIRDVRVLGESGKGDGEVVYKIKVLTTALTRGEAGWEETLTPARWREGVGGAVPGHDVVGVVVERRGGAGGGEREDEFEIGAKVWGLLAFERDGAAAEFAIARQSELARLPGVVEGTGVGEREWEEQLAVIPLSGLSAWQALFVHGGLAPRSSRGDGNLNPGKAVLVTGAAGTVGNLAVQLARAAGFYVVAVSGKNSADMVKESLRPEELLVYDALGHRGIAEGLLGVDAEGADVVIDTVGGNLLAEILGGNGMVKNGGVVVSVAHPLAAFGSEQSRDFEARLAERRVKFQFFVVEPDGARLEAIGGLVENGKVKGFVDSVYTLEKGMQAMERVEAKEAKRKGKVVLRVA